MSNKDFQLCSVNNRIKASHKKLQVMMPKKEREERNQMWIIKKLCLFNQKTNSGTSLATKVKKNFKFIDGQKIKFSRKMGEC